MEYMINYDNAQHFRSLSPLFQKLIEHNQRCTDGARVAFVDAMRNYEKHQRVAAEHASYLNSSWIARNNPFGSHAQYAKMVKNVPAAVYLFMVAFTFALYQYELMFYEKCVDQFNLYNKSIAKGDATSITSVPATSTDDPVVYTSFATRIGEWLKSDHTLGEHRDDPTSFMREIGTNALLDKQFASTKPTSTGGRRGHGSKRRNKRANTRARRMRRTNKRLSSF